MYFCYLRCSYSLELIYMKYFLTLFLHTLQLQRIYKLVYHLALTSSNDIFIHFNQTKFAATYFISFFHIHILKQKELFFVVFSRRMSLLNTECILVGIYICYSDGYKILRALYFEVYALISLPISCLCEAV